MGTKTKVIDSDYDYSYEESNQSEAKVISSINAMKPRIFSTTNAAPTPSHER